VAQHPLHAVHERAGRADELVRARARLRERGARVGGDAVDVHVDLLDLVRVLLAPVAAARRPLALRGGLVCGAHLLPDTRALNSRRSKHYKAHCTADAAHATHPEAARGPQLLVQQPRRDAQLLCAVGEQLQVHEVARQAHVPEDGLLELHIQAVEHAVDLQTRNLRLGAPPRPLQPVDVVLVALHVRDEQLHRDGRARAALHPSLDDDVSLHVDGLHNESRRPDWHVQMVLIFLCYVLFCLCI